MTKSERKKFIKDTFSATEVGVLIEDMQNGIQVIGEQHGEIIKKIESMDSKLDKFVIETRDNFKAVFDIEKKLEEYKKQQTMLSVKM